MHQSVWRRVAVALLAAGTMANASLGATAPAPFEEGDRVCFMGDSITHNGLYHSFLYLFYQTRYPEMRVEFLNCGISGGRTTDGLARLHDDVLSKSPTVVVINLGMNDVGTSHYTEKEETERDEMTAMFLDRYRSNLLQIVEGIRTHDPNIRIILTSPSPYDQTGTQARESAVGKNDAIAEVTKFLIQTALDEDLEFANFHSPMDAINREGQANDPDFTVVSQDRVHPGPAGHTVMAYLVLRAQDLEGTVSEVDIDFADGSPAVVATKKAEVDGLSAEDGVLTFTVLAESLPFPVEDVVRKSGEPTARAALEWVPFLEEMNREILRIGGLSEPRYELAIDETPVGIYTSEELAEGINLAGNNLTPQYRQAEQLALLNDRRWDLERPLRGPAWVKYKVVWEGDVDPTDEAAFEAQLERWREGTAHRGHNATYDRHYAEFKHPAVYAEREAEIEKLVDQIYAENKPRELRYSLTPTEAEKLAEPEAAAADGINAGLESYATILEFDELSAWRGLEADTADPKSGTAAGLWEDTVDTNRIRCSAFPSDLSAFDTMRVWIHSEKATGAMFAMVFRSENEATEGPDYQMTRVTVDWTGWKQVEVSLNSLDSIREPMGLAHLTEFLMASSGYKCGDADPETRLKFDQMEFLRVD